MLFNPDIKIYVAGHTGLVGKELLKQLLAFGYDNVIVRDKKELDLRNQKDTENFFKKEKPDIVYLAAGKVGGIYSNKTQKAEYLYDNLAISTNVIHSSYKYGIKKLLNISSASIYPNFIDEPLKEESLLSGSIDSDTEPYSIAKIAGLKLCQFYNHQYGTNYISLIPSNLYGKTDNFNLETTHVLPAIIRKILLAKAVQNHDFQFIVPDLTKNNIGFGYDSKIDTSDNDSMLMALCELGIELDSVKFWGSGNSFREFLYVEDFVDACIYFMDNFDSTDINEYINIGTGTDISIKDLANSVKDIVGYHGKIKFDIKMPEGTNRKLLDVSKAQNLGWTSRTPLKKGIRLMIENYLSSGV